MEAALSQLTVNKAHPINEGLLGWWLNLPNRHWGGGNSYRDLMRRFDGVLTNMESDDWRGPTGRPGGWGAHAFDGGGTESIIVPSGLLGSIAGSTSASVACWFFKTTFAPSFATLYDATTVASANRMFSFFINTASAGFAAVANSNGTGQTYSPVWTLNEWQHAVLTCDGSFIRAYRNGIKNAQNSAGIGSGFLAAQWEIGGNPSTGGTYWDGQLDDLRFYDRGLTDQEVADLYQESKAGYPRALNWVRKAYAVPAVAAGFPIRLVGEGGLAGPGGLVGHGGLAA